MGQSNEFRQYAEEAMLNASQTKNEQEKKALMNLAHVWAIAALESERAEACDVTAQESSPQTSPQPKAPAPASPSA